MVDPPPAPVSFIAPPTMVAHLPWPGSALVLFKNSAWNAVGFAPDRLEFTGHKSSKCGFRKSMKFSYNYVMAVAAIPGLQGDRAERQRNLAGEIEGRGSDGAGRKRGTKRSVRLATPTQKAALWA